MPISTQNRKKARLPAAGRGATPRSEVTDSKFSAPEDARRRSSRPILTSQLKVISLFSGAMGLDLGLEAAGFSTKVAVEMDRWAAETIKANKPEVAVFQREIQLVTAEELKKAAKIRPGDVVVVAGAPPCEPFSIAGRRNGFVDHRASGVYEFIRVVRAIRPNFFVFEEVPGFVRAAHLHASFYERVRNPQLYTDPNWRLGGAFDEIIGEIEDTGYSLSSGILNAADYGSGQKRKRFILIGSRSGEPVPLPTPTHAKPGSLEVSEGSRLPWRTLRDEIGELVEAEPECSRFPDSWGKYLRLVPQGGCWRDLPRRLHKKVLGGAYDDPNNALTRGLKGGRTGFMRRLSWDRPAPTLTDSPNTKASCLCHPEADRPLSVREYARLQGFPDAWIFCGGRAAKYRLIGQATPVPLAHAVGSSLMAAVTSRTPRAADG